MDFLSAFPYWGILLITAINAAWVWRRKVEVEEEPGDKR